MKKERKDTTVNISDVTSYNMKVLCAVRGIQHKEFVDMMVRNEMDKQGLKYALAIPE